MSLRIRRNVHQLHRQIDELGRRVGGFRRQDVLLAQDRDFVAVDQKPGALIGVGDHAGADDDPFVRLEFDFQSHACSPLPLLTRSALIDMTRVERPSPDAPMLLADATQSFLHRG